MVTKYFIKIYSGCSVKILSGNFTNTREGGSSSNFNLDGGDIYIYGGNFYSSCIGSTSHTVYVGSGHVEIYDGKFQVLSDTYNSAIVSVSNGLSKVYGGYFKSYNNEVLVTNISTYFWGDLFETGYGISSELIEDGEYSGYYPFAPITYTITINEDGGDELSNITYNIETTTITFPTPTKQDYSFFRWEITAVNALSYGWHVGSTYLDTTLEIDGRYGNITLIAKWTLKTYNITYVTNGGNNNASNVTTYTIENESVTLLDGSRPGYIFVGWFLYEAEMYYDVNNLGYDSLDNENLNISNAITSFENPTGNKTLYAKWLACPSVSIKFNDTLSSIDLPDGWEWESPTIVAPHAGNNSFNIVYTYNDISKTASYPIYVSKLQITRPSANLSYFTYSGSEQTYTVETNSFYTVTNNKRTLTGSQFVRLSLTDKFNTQWDNGNADDFYYTFVIYKALPLITLTPSYNTVIWGRNLGTSILTDGGATVEGTFAWENSSEVFDSVGTFERHCVFTPTDTDNYESITTNVSIQVVPIVVVFKNYDDSVLSAQNIPYNTFATIPENPTKPSTQQYNYTFNGWGNEVEDPITQDTIFMAQYESDVNQYTYTFYDEDETTILKQELVDYGSTIEEPNSPSKSSTDTLTYSFDGWNQEVPATITQNITFVAQYESSARLYTIILKNDLGEEIDTLQVEYEEIETEIEIIPEKESTKSFRYSFIGWQTSTDEITGDIIKIALFQEIKIEKSLWWLWTLIGLLLIAGAGVTWLLVFKKQTITFILNGNEVGKLKYKFNETLEFPLNLARYKWFTDEEEKTIFVQRKMKLKSFVLYRNTKNDNGIKNDNKTKNNDNKE